ncbi:MAG TPA: methyltransferase domain-containing protein [Thermoguttaceae bacterium]|nr:methyltransferase domain-containing protein [Thermoguttaceae bacterium]
MHRVLSATVVTASLLLAAAAPIPVGAAETKEESESPRSPDCVYVGTPYDVIDKMLDMGSIRKSDVVYDLGCGDGRIVVAAAKRFGCRGVGYDINPQRIEESLEKVRKHQVERLVEIEQEDIFTLDLGKADVIMLYLLPDMNVQLIPQLEQLKPGARIVCHNYDIEGIVDDKYATVRSLEDGVKHYIYLYTAPLKKQASE